MMSEKPQYCRVTNKCCEDWNESGCLGGMKTSQHPSFQHWSCSGGVGNSVRAQCLAK